MYRYKYKWPSDQQKSGSHISDFVPYISNVANMFSRVPNPTAPTTINPVVNPKISLANSRSEVENASRAADLSTQGLDANTGAAVRVGNTANKLRALSDINSREAMANAQTTSQTNMVNANIEAQNAAMTNQYHDELTNAQLTRNRLKSENLSNAADKYIGQEAVQDQMQLERDKANIYSKMYTPGVYDRLLKKLQTTGTDTSQLGTTTATKTPSVFDKFRNMDLPAYTPQVDLPTNANSPSVDNSPLPMEQMPNSIMTPLKRYLQQRNTYAAGGMMDVLGGPGPAPKEPVRPIGQVLTDAGVAGTNSFNTNAYAMDYGTNRMSHGIDVINDLVKTGTLPHNASTPSAVKSLLDPKMYNYLYEFNQRSDMGGMNPEQRLQAFYNIQAHDPDVQSMKDNMRRFGYGPLDFSRGSHMQTLQKANGGSIHINPANKGKFTASASHAGMGVQQYASHVLNDPNASPLQKKRANFARNAAKWHHAMGGKLIKPFC